MTARASVVLLLSTAFLAACSTTGPEPIAPPPVAEAPAVAEPVAPVVSAHDALFKLFKDSDEAQLKRNPLFALFRGDMRYADQFGDYITDEYLAGEKAALESELAAPSCDRPQPAQRHRSAGV